MAQKLKINAKPTFSAPVLLTLAGDDGKTVEIHFTAVFRRLPDSQAKDVQKRMDGGTMTDDELIALVLCGWSQLEADDGTPFAFTAENLAAAREDWPTFAAAIIFSYFKHNDAAVIKNSARPSASS